MPGSVPPSASASAMSVPIPESSVPPSASAVSVAVPGSSAYFLIFLL